MDEPFDDPLELPAATGCLLPDVSVEEPLEVFSVEVFSVEVFSGDFFSVDDEPLSRLSVR